MQDTDVLPYTDTSRCIIVDDSRILYNEQLCGKFPKFTAGAVFTIGNSRYICQGPPKI